jgi:NADH:ubiquinone oxidoreductase subunit E
MEEEMMDMEVAPVMMPDQQMPQGQQMMQGTPAAPVLPEQLQAQINSLSEQEKDEAKQALMQIMQIVQQMEAEGATPQQIEEFLKQIGMTLEELEMAEEMFGMGDGALGFTI